MECPSPSVTLHREVYCSSFKKMWNSWLDPEQATSMQDLHLRFKFLLIACTFFVWYTCYIHVYIYNIETNSSLVGCIPTFASSAFISSYLFCVDQFFPENSTPGFRFPALASWEPVQGLPKDLMAKHVKNQGFTPFDSKNSRISCTFYPELITSFL